MRLSAFPTKQTVLMFLLAAAVITAVYALGAFLRPPSMFFDPAVGFLCLKDMERGGDFNVRVTPDPNNIAVDWKIYETWWSPGQYMIPGFFKIFFRWGLGPSMALTAFLFSILGLFGFYRLYRYLGVSPLWSSISLAVIASTRAFALPFSMYNGGEILIFGGFPWIAIGILRFSSWRFHHALAVLAVLFCGAFLKLSFSVYVPGLLLAAMILRWRKNNVSDPKQFIGDLVKTGILLTVYSVALKIWLSRAPLAVDDTIKPFEWNLNHWTAPPAFSLSAAFSGFDFLLRILMHPDARIVRSVDDLGFFYLAVALFAAVLGFAILRSSMHAIYKIFLSAMFVSVNILMAIFYSFDAGVELHERHFRILGILFLPGILELLGGQRRGIAKIFGCFSIIIFSVYGLSSYAARYAQLGRDGFVGPAGFTHLHLKAEDMMVLRRIDQSLPAGKNNVFFAPFPTMALEVHNPRIIFLHADFDSHQHLLEKAYYGRVDNILVVLETHLIQNGKAEIILRAFKDYRYEDWNHTAIGRFTYFAQGLEAETLVKALSVEIPQMAGLSGVKAD